MTETTEATTEAQSETTGKPAGGDWLEAKVADLDPLPTPSEAELGELCRTPSGGQFDQCELVDNTTANLIGAILREDEIPEASDEDVREAIEAFERGEN